MTTAKGESPRRGIYNDKDMASFIQSSTKQELLSFVEAMGKSCASGDEAIFDSTQPLVGISPSMASLHGALRQMVTWVDDFPPTTADTVRFGNPSFRQWHSRLLERSNAILTVILQSRDDKNISNEQASKLGWDAAAGKISAKSDESIQQVACYLHDSFGHATRLDYGTGHESSFLVFLLVLSKVKCLGDTPSPVTLRNVTLSIMNQYLLVTRRLQTDYRLEPAGSHGVWGLDDYHCLPFYFGACQLQANKASITPQNLTDPKVVNDEDMLRDYGDNYMYIGCIRYIRTLKRGVPFFESSPMLYDISQTMPTWEKVSRGLMRLYQGEVLEKRQVVQHFVFSKHFPMTWAPSKLTEPTAPTETFRGDVPVTSAPWAAGPGGATPGDMQPTRAPWATNPSDAMPPTKAPWAK